MWAILSRLSSDFAVVNCNVNDFQQLFWHFNCMQSGYERANEVVLALITFSRNRQQQWCPNLSHKTLAAHSTCVWAANNVIVVAAALAITMSPRESLIFRAIQISDKLQSTASIWINRRVCLAVAVWLAMIRRKQASERAPKMESEEIASDDSNNGSGWFVWAASERESSKVLKWRTCTLWWRETTQATCLHSFSFINLTLTNFSLSLVILAEPTLN
jgi:hypothetical protein